MSTAEKLGRALAAAGVPAVVQINGLSQVVLHLPDDGAAEDLARRLRDTTPWPAPSAVWCPGCQQPTGQRVQARVWCDCGYAGTAS